MIWLSFVFLMYSKQQEQLKVSRYQHLINLYTKGVFHVYVQVLLVGVVTIQEVDISMLLIVHKFD